MKKKAELIRYWIKTSDLDFDAALSLFQSAKYPHALFYLHLSIEKLLKAYYVQVLENHPPKTHNLVMIQKASGLEFPSAWTDTILEFNTFNQEARYPDEKLVFYKKCTHAFTQNYIQQGEEIRQWLKTKF